MGCTNPPYTGAGAPLVPSRVGSTLPLPRYADVQLHILMTLHNNAGRRMQLDQVRPVPV